MLVRLDEFMSHRYPHITKIEENQSVGFDGLEYTIYGKNKAVRGYISKLELTMAPDMKMAAFRLIDKLYAELEEIEQNEY